MTDAEREPFRRAFVRYRRAKRMSQNELSERSLIDSTFISRIENGNRWPSRDSIVRLSRAMGLSTREEDDLLTLAGFAPSDLRSVVSEPLLIDLDDIISLLPTYERDTIHNQVRGVVAYAQAALARYEGRVA